MLSRLQQIQQDLLNRGDSSGLSERAIKPLVLDYPVALCTREILTIQNVFQLTYFAIVPYDEK
jgi:hypothetical protein